MNEESKFPALVSYVNTIVLADLALLVISFVLGGFSMAGALERLPYVAVAALFVGLVMRSGYRVDDLWGLLADTTTPIMKATGGRRPGDPLRDYAGSFEYKRLEPHLERGSQGENAEYGVRNMDEEEDLRLRGEKHAKMANAIMIASVVAIASGFILNALFV